MDDVVSAAGQEVAQRGEDAAEVETPLGAGGHPHVGAALGQEHPRQPGQQGRSFRRTAVADRGRAIGQRAPPVLFHAVGGNVERQGWTNQRALDEMLSKGVPTTRERSGDPVKYVAYLLSLIHI